MAKRKKASKKKSGRSYSLFKKGVGRKRQVLGLFIILFAVYVAIALISYLFTWKLDQDEVFHWSWSILLHGEVEIANWLGRLGGIISHQLMYWTFGLSSFGFIWILGEAGLRLVVKANWSGYFNKMIWILTSMVIFSVVLSFLSGTAAFPVGGAIGDSMTYWLSNFLGEIGLFLLLVTVIVTYFIWMFKINLADVKLVPDKNWFPTGRFAFAGLSQNKPNHSSKAEFREAPVKEKAPAPETLRPSDDEPEGYKEDPYVGTDDFNKEGELTIIDTLSKEEEESAKKEPPSPKNAESPLEALEDNKPHLDLNEPYDPVNDLSRYKFPEVDLLVRYEDDSIIIDREELEEKKNQIIRTLLNYKIEITKIRATVGPTVTLYEIVPAPGIRISKIRNLEDDIALSLSALGIRIIAPIPGKGTIGIEVPNKKKQIVGLRDVLTSDKYQKSDMELPIVLGRTIANEVFVTDLAKMPHLLIAGATGQGKSVGINTILISLLYRMHPAEMKLVLIDPKKVELFPYSYLDKHYLGFLPGQDEPIVTDTQQVVFTLNSLCVEMDQRYDLMKKAKARNISEYNKKFRNRKLNPLNGHKYLPYIVLVIDEFADLIMTAGKEIELPIGRLAQLARAVGIHLIIATQRPSVKIITGVIKANFPARIAYKVTSNVDSRTILDGGGAEQLIGRGDMLLSQNGKIIRLQCAFVDTPEVESVIAHIANQQGFAQPYFLPEYDENTGVLDSDTGLTVDELDENFEDAARLIVQTQQGSTSMIQRKLQLGYNRAGRIIDQLEAMNVVGPHEGSKAREVLIQTEVELDKILSTIKESDPGV